MHLNNPAGSSSNLSGADKLAVIAVALRLLTPPGSRSEGRRKADHEQAGIGEPPPSLDARRSFYSTGSIHLNFLKFEIRLALFFVVAGRPFSKPRAIKVVWFSRDAS
jgi:hypothetical protein